MSADDTMLAAALEYASWGWPVLPLVPGGKVPATAHGVHDASTDPERIRAWWGANPQANIGIAAGVRSGLMVLDVDPRNGGDDSWARLTAACGEPPDTPQALTAGGGEHFVFRYDPAIRSAKLAEGVDLLADGRYFVAYPSQVNGRHYVWEASSDPADGLAPAPLPESWRQAILGRRKAPAAANDSIIVGNRNAGLTSLAGAMRRHGMSESEILAALTVANDSRCEIPLPSSELAQIARSVARYEPESDVAASAALGAQAAEMLLEPESEYRLTRATAFLSQPSPLRWVIKGWIPEASLAMVYGESGSGKTFVTLDMACSIAAGIAWQGQRCATGTVIYLAGEGNYGLRQRIAAWCRHHNVQSLDNLLVSSRAIDIDGPAVGHQITQAIRELASGPVVAIVVDTVNNHMSGDENSAKDTRMMVNACQSIARTFSAATILNHHTGLSVEAAKRARGSSAWKASLDAAILVTKDDGVIELSVQKMKDAEMPAPMLGRLAPVELGWTDDEGQPVRSVAFMRDDQAMPAASSPASRKPSRIDSNRKLWENAWTHAGAELRNGTPYLSRSALLDYLTGAMGLSPGTAKVYAKAGAPGKMIHDLLAAGIVQAHEHGWIMCNQVHSGALLMARSGGGTEP